MKKYLAILFFLIMLPLVSASSNVQISSQTPTWDGQKLTDYQGYKYSVAGNGLYQIEYSSQSTYFGFGLTGKYNGVNFTKLSTDYSWSTQLNTLSNGYEASTTTSGGEWKTNFTFTDSKTKILNTLTNILPMSITNAKFYYLFSVSTGDVIKYNGQNYTVSSSPNVHISGNLNSIVTATINNNVLFNFEDIISNGFNVTDVYIVPTSTLGFNSNLSVVAIGFTKGNGVIQSGQIITIDPQIYASNTVKYSDTGSVTGTATSYTKRKTLTMTDSYTGSWRILFDLRTSTAGTTVYGQVRKNGNVYGSEFSTTSASLQTESQNFTGISISSGDTIELWDYTTNGAVNVVVQNFYIEFDINITNATYLPLVPVISSITTGTNYINQSWQAGSGNITNYYNVSMNGTWYNGTTNTYFNNTPLLNSSSSNLIVWAINSSNATTLSLTALTNYTHMPVQLYLIYPNNCSTNIPTIVNLTWSEEPQNPAYTYQVSVNSGFSNIISSGSTNNQYSGNINLNPNTTYYWHVKNSTGAYLPTFSFLTSPPAPIPGRFNISVFDEVNHSLPILSYTAQVQNGSTALTKTTTTGWANFSAAEVTNGMYLIYITTPLNPAYYPRMELAISPADVVMYLPNSTNATINIVSFSLLDVSGKYSYTTSTITISRGGFIMDSSNFSSDGTHAVYLIQGLMYQVTIRNGNNIFSTNYLPSGSGTSVITINDMSVNMTNMYPFRYNISYNSSQVTLNWLDVKGILNSLNFTVNKGTPEVNQCQLVTSVPSGQSPCSIDNFAQYHVIFSANTTEGFYNQSFFIDYSTGFIKPSNGVNPIDGSPMGIGFNMSIGTFTMPQNILNWVSLLIVILLAGSFGARYANIGAIVVGIVLIILESVGWFVPVTTVSNTVIMGITGGLTFFAFLYFMQAKDRNTGS